MRQQAFSQLVIAPASLRSLCLAHEQTVSALVCPMPAVCQQFVSQHPSNQQIAAAAHWLLRQAVGWLCLGCREHLEAAAGAATEADKCTAVVWSLEVRGAPL